MGDYVKYAVSVDVVDEYNVGAGAVTGSEGTPAPSDSARVERRIQPEIGKTLGGGRKYDASVTVGVGGWTDGDPTHVICATTGTNYLVGSASAAASVKAVFIKHSGYSDDAKTTATTALLTVKSDSGNIISVLGPGGAIVLPFETATAVKFTGLSSSGDIAVEVMGTA